MRTKAHDIHVPLIIAMPPKKVNRRADHVGQHRTAYDKNKKRILSTQDVCGICGQPVDKSIKDPKDPNAPVIDHIVPIARGGHPSDINNLQLAHRWCNRQKSDKLFDTKKYENEENTMRNDDLPLHLDWAHYKA